MIFVLFCFHKILCQPLDVAGFTPIKRCWKMVLNDWKNKNTRKIPKSAFPKLFQNMLESLNEKWKLV